MSSIALLSKKRKRKSSSPNNGSENADAKKKSGRSWKVSVGIPSAKSVLWGGHFCPKSAWGSVTKVTGMPN